MNTNTPAARTLHRQRQLYGPNAALVLDGAIATALEHEMGLNLHPQLWSAMLVHTHPDSVKRLHRMYLESGADIITTCSYQVSFDTFEKYAHGMDRHAVANLLRRSVQLAHEARRGFWNTLTQNAGSDDDDDDDDDDDCAADAEASQRRVFPLVAFSMSPYGASIVNDDDADVDDRTAQEYAGDYVDPQSKLFVHRDRLKQFHWERLQCVLATTGTSRQDEQPDIVLFETVPALEEAAAICEMLQEKADSLYVHSGGQWVKPTIIISFSCKDTHHTCRGDSVADCARLIESCEQVDGIAVNCVSPKHVAQIVTTMRQHTQKIVGCYPNNGEEWNQLKQGWDQPDSPADMLSPALVKNYVCAGASIVGSCCRTGPKDTRTISQELRNWWCTRK